MSDRELLCQSSLPEVEVEDTRPDEREETPSEVANEAHEETEVRDEHRHQEGEEDASHAEPAAPDLQFSVL